MTGDVAAVRALEGRGLNGNRCRINSCSENETLAHVLGFCRKGELIRINRHNAVRILIANAFSEKEWTVYEEVHCESEDGSNRRLDIIVIKNNIAYVLDPTIRFETGRDQGAVVDAEKKRIYEPCSIYLM